MSLPEGAGLNLPCVGAIISSQPQCQESCSGDVLPAGTALSDAIKGREGTHVRRRLQGIRCLCGSPEVRRQLLTWEEAWPRWGEGADVWERTLCGRGGLNHSLPAWKSICDECF